MRSFLFLHTENICIFDACLDRNSTHKATFHHLSRYVSFLQLQTALTPSLTSQGIAHRILPAQLERILRTSGYKPVKVTCQIIDADNNWQRTGKPFEATTLIAKDAYRSSRLMPSVKAFSTVYRSALVSSLSVDYLGHITLLRPYVPAHMGKNAERAQRLFKACVLAPQFLAFYMPLAGLQKLLGQPFHLPIERLKLHVGDLIRSTSILVERLLFRPIFGDIAYGIEND